MERNVLYPGLVSEMARRGEKQKDLAKILGISVPGVCLRLQGKIEWGIGEIDILCEHFDKDYYQLFK